ncbi:MAG: glucose 1-dehydrogenase [Gammaproteobacteria bacterium]|nr:glucose 1-dehydrogenase [Gammaproteobacteria bacterium]MDH3447892.1 glucose 1-dehydrogenase [Gammaproteobacteria bacterium]
MILKNRIAIVTGAGSGIGRASAEILAREGAIVTVADLDPKRAEATVARITERGGHASALGTDVGDDAQLRTLVETTISRHRRIDILHSHVGVQVNGTAEQVDPDGMDRSWDLNVRAHFMAARLVIPQMKSQGGGSIVITSSNSGVQLDREMIAYATSKHAAVSMARQMALDYARFNIRVNALCPGWVDTPFNEPFMRQMGGREALEEYVRTQIPMGRWATVDEIAEALLFLASDRSSFMTGQALVVDGGECLA